MLEPHSMPLEPVDFESLGVIVRGYFLASKGKQKAPTLIIAHGAGDSKENYLEMATYLSKRGISSLLLDMHGHGASGGRAYHVRMEEWVADLRSALDYLETRPDVDPNQIGAFGISSGGTAILEAALVDERLGALVTLDATVMNTLPLPLSLALEVLTFAGRVKQAVTGTDLRISITRLLDDVPLASDPEVNARLQVDPGKLRAFENFPLPGARESFFVDTIRRVPKIKIPTLVIWGEDDQLDPVSTAHKLYDALTCTKKLEIISGNGHAGHLDRNRVKVFDAVADWIAHHLAK
jgi:alpha-beta hydrolase superfamily lysophospholipase